MLAEIGDETISIWELGRVPHKHEDLTLASETNVNVETRVLGAW